MDYISLSRHIPWAYILPTFQTSIWIATVLPSAIPCADVDDPGTSRSSSTTTLSDQSTRSAADSGIWLFERRVLVILEGRLEISLEEEMEADEEEQREKEGSENESGRRRLGKAEISIQVRHSFSQIWKTSTDLIDRRARRKDFSSRDPKASVSFSLWRVTHVQSYTSPIFFAWPMLFIESLAIQPSQDNDIFSRCADGRYRARLRLAAWITPRQLADSSESEFLSPSYSFCSFSTPSQRKADRTEAEGKEGKAKGAVVTRWAKSK